jgi:acetylornithine deacetylase/succinyl-diaminopimelate desuccinylase-like protein
VVVAGPGEANVGHQTDERMSVPKYRDTIRLYIGVVLAYLG